MKNLNVIAQSILVTIASLTVWEFAAKPAISKFLKKDNSDEV